MTPTRQTIFVATHPKKRGNCLSACLASLLDLPLDQVIDTTADEVREDFHCSVARFLADHGLKTEDVFPDEDQSVLEGVYSIGSGPPPRGDFWHAVVCKNGKMVFDPHPSDDGIGTIERHEILVPMTEVEKAMHAKGLYRRRMH